MIGCATKNHHLIEVVRVEYPMNAFQDGFVYCVMVWREMHLRLVIHSHVGVFVDVIEVHTDIIPPLPDLNVCRNFLVVAEPGATYAEVRKKEIAVPIHTDLEPRDLISVGGHLIY